MKCIKDLITDFSYGQAEFFTALAYEKGIDMEFNSIKALEVGEDDSSGFTVGSLIGNAMKLYVYYIKSNNPKSGEVILRINKFIDMIGDAPFRTWGKLSVLNGLCYIKDAGIGNILNNEHIDILKEKTDYSDFLDKETLKLKGYPTNYYHVALACAGYREKLGWENNGYSETIKNKLISIMKDESDAGWMDEQPPYGRYDRYSFIISAELCATLDAIDKEVPDFILSNLKKAADMALMMSNEYGDGFLYGRSLSVHGDCAAVEVISTALKYGLIDKNKIDEAICYTIKIIEKTLNFWYSDKMKSFNLWCGGRTTNQYRHIHRILEVNLDMNNHLISTLDKFEKAGYAEYIPNFEYQINHKWKCSEVVFSENEASKRCTYILNYKGRLIMLPLINGGNYTRYSAYLPFPTMAEKIEAPPETYLPFLTPELILENGEYVMPVSHIQNSDYKAENDEVVINYSGKLCKINHLLPEKSEFEFKVNCRFYENKIKVTFNINSNVLEARMIYAGKAQINGFGFDSELHYNTENNPDYFTPHGPLNNAVLYTGSGNSFGYEIEID